MGIDLFMDINVINHFYYYCSQLKFASVNMNTKYFWSQNIPAWIPPQLFYIFKGVMLIGPPFKYILLEHNHVSSFFTWRYLYHIS